MSWMKQEKLADEILARPEKIIFVNKQGTRVGATTSIIKRALEHGLTVTVFEPFHDIIDKTVFKAGELAGLKDHEMGHLYSNEIMCPKHKKYPHIPFAFKGTCNGCIHPKGACLYQIFLETPYRLMGMTYHKLMLINKYETEDIELIKAKVLASDVIFLDEFSHAVHVSPYQVDLNALSGVIGKIVASGKEPNTETWRKILDLKDGVYNTGELGARDWVQASKWIDEYNLNKAQTETLLEAIQVLEYDRFLIAEGTRKKWNPVQRKHVFETFPALIPDMFHPMELFKEMVSEYKGKIIITDALLPTTKVLEGINVNWPDFKNTQANQLIICDTRNSPLALYTTDLSRYGKEYYEELDRLKEFLKNMCMRWKPENFVVFSPNISIHNTIKAWENEFRGMQFLEYPRISYYRSEITAGTPLKDKIVICVGLPETPINSFAGYATVFCRLPEYDRYRKMFSKAIVEEKVQQLVRKDEIKNQLFNTVGRNKDDTGQKNSVIIVFGATPEKVKDCLPTFMKAKIVGAKGDQSFDFQAEWMADMWLQFGNKNALDYQYMPVHAGIAWHIVKNKKVMYNIGTLSNRIGFGENEIKGACNIGETFTLNRGFLRLKHPQEFEKWVSKREKALVDGTAQQE